MDKNITVIRQLNYMVSITIITQFFTLLKNSLVASHFGVSSELDAFNLTNNITTFIYGFIGAGISTVIIPYLKDKKNKEAINIFISIIYTICFFILIIIFMFSKQIISLISGTSDSLFLDMASKLIIFTVIAGFIDSLTQFVRAVLEFNGQFNRQKLAILFTTLLVVLYLLFSNNISIYYYAAVLLITTTLNIILHLSFLKKSEFKYKINYDVRNSNFRDMIKLYFPIVLSTGVYQISTIIDTSIAARLGVGSISILNYANSIIGMINLLFLGNLTSFIYPRLVKKTNDYDRQSSLTTYILFINVIMCLIIVLFYSAGREGVSILFERGKFTNENTHIVYLCSLIFVISLPTNGVRDLFYRYFYINNDTYTPFVNSLITSLINIVISLILSKYVNLYGVIIGTVFASYVSLISIYFRFSKKFPTYFDKKDTFVENLKIVLVTSLTVAIYTLSKTLLVIVNPFIELLTHSAITLLIFLILLRIFRSKVLKIKL